MGGGLLQLLAKGAQDVHFTTDPQMSFFRASFRRHANFAIETVQVPFVGKTAFGKRITCVVPKAGDLVGRMYLRMTLPPVEIQRGYAFRWLDYIGLLLIDRIELEIGGVRADLHTGEWLYLWNQLTKSPGHFLGYSNLVGHTPRLAQPTYNNTAETIVLPSETLYIPLEFWFNRHASHALPLIAMHHHDVRVHVTLRDAKDCTWFAVQNAADNSTWTTIPTGGAGVTIQGDLSDVDMFIDYVFLDAQERKIIGGSPSLDYAVTQLHINEFEAPQGARQHKLELDFNHPCTELVWVSQRGDFVSDDVPPGQGSNFENIRPGGKQWFNYGDDYDQTYRAVNRAANGLEPLAITGGLNDTFYASLVGAGGSNGSFVRVSYEGGRNPTERATLYLNGTERQVERDGKYYNVIVPMQHHTNVPPAGVNVLAFALRPESIEPSGGLNLSRIDATTLHVTLTEKAVATRPSRIRVYGVNLNILHIEKGLAGMLYAN